MELSDPKKIRSKLLDYLARREHSDHELRAKLRKKVESIEELENKAKMKYPKEWAPDIKND